jgi:MerR family copper efflux transcriptional regulator
MTNGAPLSIGAVARSAGVSVQAVRYYERIGLLPRPARASSGYRKYDGDTISRLRFVRRAAELGFTLAEIRELLALRARDGAPCKSVFARAEGKLQAIERKLVELTQLRDAVASLVRACSGDRAVEHCSILAALSDSTPRQPNEEGTKPWPQRQPSPAPRRASRARKRASAASRTA